MKKLVKAGRKGVLYMMFLGHLLTTALQYIVTIAVSCVGGIYVGKILRDKKTAKQKTK